MRIKDSLYFAPRIQFWQLLTLDSKRTVDAYKDRIDGFYLSPARELIKNRKEEFAFIAGMACFAAIDAIAKTTMPNDTSSKRFKEWITQNLPDFKNLKWKHIERVYDDFRSGTIHEARVKFGGQYTFDIDKAVDISESVMRINPEKLLNQLELAFGNYIREIRKDDRKADEFKKNVMRDFKDDLTFAKSENPDQDSAIVFS